MSVRSEVIALLDAIAALDERNFADHAPAAADRPYSVTLDHIGQASQLRGDGRSMARRRILQVDLWQNADDDDGTLSASVENALDGAALTAGLRLSVTESHRVAEVDHALSHFVFTCETTVLR